MNRKSHSELFSITIPTFNRALYLYECLESVCGQSYRPIGIVIVDDGSTDTSKNIIEKWIELYACKELSATYIYQENADAAVARNRGISVAKGIYVQFFDSDDLLHPQRLEILARIF